MIARLRGTLIERDAEHVVIECAGVGYDVGVSLYTLSALPQPGDEVVLRVFTHAQENKLALYGFYTAEERDLFDRLITVKNVGPATAMEILSASPSPAELARLIVNGDVTGLTRIRGIGKKRAELLVVELKDKCEPLLVRWGASGAMPTLVTSPRPVPAIVRPPLLDDVASALVNLGWRPAEADKVLEKLEIPPGATIELVLREALRAMPR